MSERSSPPFLLEISSWVTVLALLLPQPLRALSLEHQSWCTGWCLCWNVQGRQKAFTF